MKRGAWTEYHRHRDPIRLAFQILRFHDGYILSIDVGRRLIGVAIPWRRGEARG